MNANLFPIIFLFLNLSIFGNKISIALKVPEATDLKKFVNGISNQLDDEQSIFVENNFFHVTLSFISDVNTKELVKVERILNNLVLQHNKIKNLSFQKTVKFFGLRKNALVLLLTKNKSLKKLYDDLNDALQEQNIEPSDIFPFSPHVTLGYFDEEWIKKNKNKKRIKLVCSNGRRNIRNRFNLDQITITQSQSHNQIDEIYTLKLHK